MKNIIWLASYPKSGNTWLRVFLTNLLRDADEPAGINQLEKSPIASSRDVFDDAVGIAASDLTFAEVDQLRPELYRLISRQSTGPCFIKIHDAYTFLPDGRPLVPTDATHCVLYIIRNPLDVVISFANHLGAPIDRALKRMEEEDFCFSGSPKRLCEQLRQRLLSWSGHVRSWTQAQNLKVHTMRYEDMKLNPLEIFTLAVRFAGLTYSSQQIEKALKFSEFSEMQRQEQEKGFKEKPLRAESFFRKGEVGTWREVLNKGQVKKIIHSHGEVMKRFGYLDKRGVPVF